MLLRPSTDIRPKDLTRDVRGFFNSLLAMNEDRPFFSNLKCRECGRLYEKEAIHICEYDFGPLEAAYDYDAISQSISREFFRRSSSEHVALPRTSADRWRSQPRARRWDSLRSSRATGSRRRLESRKFT